jgi:hypothetical protein
MTGDIMPNAIQNRIDKQLEGLDPASLRARVQVALRQFRSSWVDLGKLLTNVAYGGEYKDWGYEDFEVYAARELGLKKPTVKKLMVSYNYMKSYEPKRLQLIEEAGDDGEAPSVPDYQTVELLHRARETCNIEREEGERLHTIAFSGEEGEAELRRELRSHIRDSSENCRAVYDRHKELHDILRIARVLRRKLAQTKTIPEGFKDRIEQMLTELESLD